MHRALTDRCDSCSARSRRHLPVVASICALSMLPQWPLHVRSGLDDIGFEVADPVLADQVVLGVSAGGSVLVADGPDTAGDEMCALQLDGTDEKCWAAEDPPGVLSALNWSPDGTRVAFDNAAYRPEGAGSGVRVLDTTDGSIAAVPPGRSPSDGSVDLYSAWLDDEHLTFLRRPADVGDDERRLELVEVDLQSGEEIRAVPVHLSLLDLGPQSGAVVGGRYIVSVAEGSSSVIVTADSDGDLFQLNEIDLPVVAVTSTTSDGRTGVVVSYAFDASRVGPVALISSTGTGEIAEGMRAAAATIEPAGRFVAGVVPTDPGTDEASAELVLWEPHTDETRVVVELGILATDAVWTSDDEVIVWNSEGWQVVILDRT